MFNINREELAWAAGFFDGEGCFTFAYSGRQKNRGEYPVVAITQIDRGVLDRFRNAVGIGRVHGPYNHSPGGLWRPKWKFQANGPEQTQAIGAMLWRFLSPIKRAQFKKRMAACQWAGRFRSPEHRAKIAAARTAFLARKRDLKSITLSCLKCGAIFECSMLRLAKEPPHKQQARRSFRRTHEKTCGLRSVRFSVKLKPSAPRIVLTDAI